MTCIERQLDPDRLGDYNERLYRAAWGLCGNRDEAQDLVQETYARVLARRRFLRRDDDLGYLLGALHNTFFMHLRAQKRQLRGTAVTPEADPVDQREELRPEEGTEAAGVFAAIAGLPEHFRTVILAVDVTGLSCEETASALRVPAGTVRSRLSRARDRLILGPLL